jgi:hypothetical protein
MRDACHGRAELVIERLPAPWAEEGLGSGWPPPPPPPLRRSSESGDASHSRVFVGGHVLPDASAGKKLFDAPGLGAGRHDSSLVMERRGKGCEDGGR